MRCLFLLLVLTLCTILQNANAVEPAGLVVTTPVVTWTYKSGQGTPATGALTIPNEMDDAGTLTLVFRANAATTLIRMSKADTPESIQFLFGDSDSLYLHTPRRVGWTPDTTETLQTLIPYDKSTTQPRTRRLRLVDAAGAPLHGFHLGVGFPLQFFQYSPEPKFPFPIEDDGTVNLPIIVSPVPRVTYPFITMTPTVYTLFLTDTRTSQTYQVGIPETDRTDPTNVMLPVSGGNAPASVKVLEGEIVNALGLRTNAVALGFGSSPPMMDGMTYDPTTITVKMLSPAPDGTFELAWSDEFRSRNETDEGLGLRATEHINGLFRNTWPYFPWGKNARIKLPKRLDLVGSLLGKDGTPIVLSERIAEGVSSNFSISQVDSNGKRLQWDSMNVSLKDTTGPLFNLTNLPASNRYVITAFDKQYGPVEVGETSPTTALEFRAIAQDGQRTGVVLDETGATLKGALVLLLSEQPNWTGYDDVAAIVDKLAPANKEAGLELLNAITSPTLDYIITGATGQYTLPRKTSPKNASYPIIFALAPGRFPAYLYDTTSEREVLPNMDVTLPEVRLPIKTRATGVIHAPAMVPNNDHPGSLEPLPLGDHKYRLSMWGTRWFDPPSSMSPGWQYRTQSEEFLFGQPFEYDIPVGTSYSLTARPSDYQLHLNMQLWRQGPAAAREIAQLPEATLRALQPFHLKVVYADGSPAAGLLIDALYNTESNINYGGVREPQTDVYGHQLLYGDEDKAPEITVSKNMPPYGRERFKIQPLDTSTSVPALTLRLDPKIWGPDGKGIQ